MSLIYPRRFDPISHFLWNDTNFFDSFKDSNITPVCDYHLTDNGAEISVELPGYDKKDLSITTEGRYVSIKAEKSTVSEKSSGRSIYNERYHGSYQRTIKLPFSASEDLVSARYENGVLDIFIEKPESSQPKMITIN